MTKINTFDNADFYDCRDSDEYTHQSPEECIQDRVDWEFDPKEHIRNAIDRITPLEVIAYAHNRNAKPDFIKKTAEYLLEKAIEEWDEDEDVANMNEAISVPPQHLESLIPAMAAVLEKLFEGHEAWHCEEVGRREYSYEEVIEIMKEYVDIPEDPAGDVKS